jgi:hypothetical protein
MELPRALTQEESQVVQQFEKTAEKRAKTSGINSDWSIISIACEAQINLWNFPKDGVVIQAIWVAFLSVMRKIISMNELKYPTLESFLKAYNGYFDNHAVAEQNRLWETANWMYVLFSLIPAKKNKGLAMAIIPKLIEGWYTKYITGSGQTKATADRVKIFETEGKVIPNHRGKIKIKTKNDEDSRPHTTGRKPYKKRKPSVKDISNLQYFDVKNKRIPGPLNLSNLGGHFTSNDSTDNSNLSYRSSDGTDSDDESLSSKESLKKVKTEHIDAEVIEIENPSYLRSRTNSREIDISPIDYKMNYCDDEVKFRSLCSSATGTLDGVQDIAYDMCIDDNDTDFADVLALLRNVSSGTNMSALNNPSLIPLSRMSSNGSLGFGAFSPYTPRNATFSEYPAESMPQSVYMDEDPDVKMAFSLSSQSLNEACSSPRNINYTTLDSFFSHSVKMSKNCSGNSNEHVAALDRMDECYDDNFVY